MFKKLVAPVVVSGALLGSLLVGGAAYAAAPTASTTTAPATAGAHHAKGTHHGWWKAHRRQIRKLGLAISAKAIGISPQALAAELKTGKSIAQVAGEHNVSVATVVGDLTTAADAKVAAAVAAGKLTPAQGAKITAALPVRITKIVNHVF
jgi:hypothetical protein